MLAAGPAVNWFNVEFAQTLLAGLAELPTLFWAWATWVWLGDLVHVERDLFRAACLAERQSTSDMDGHAAP